MPTVKTLDDLLNRNDRYDINKAMFYTVTNDGALVIADTNLFSIYRRFLNDYIDEYTVTDAQREKYRYRPDLLSADIYGTPSLDWMIMWLNDQECPSKFYLKSKMRLIAGPILGDIYDTIVTKSNGRLKDNWNTFLSMVDE